MQFVIMLNPSKIVNKMFGKKFNFLKIKRLVQDNHTVHSMLNSVQDALYSCTLLYIKNN